MNSLQKALISLSPVFLAACANPVIRGVDQSFDSNACASYETETFREMDGKGDDASLVKKWSGDKTVIYVDDICLKKNLLETQINEKFRVKKEAIKGLSTIVAIQLKDPKLPAAEKADLLRGYVRDLDSGTQDVIDIRRASLDAQDIDDRELLTIYIGGLLEKVEQSKGAQQQVVLNELATIKNETSFWRNDEFSALAKEVLDVDLKDSGKGYAIFAGSLDRPCEATTSANGTLVISCSAAQPAAPAVD